MPKKILTTDEEKAPFFKGMNALANAVTSTLGVSGKQVIISRGFGAPVDSTKDGYNTAFNIQLEDWVEYAGAQMLKGVAQKTVDAAGDNTTTATLLAQFIINEGIKAVKEGGNPRKIKQGIDLAVTDAIDTLNKWSKPIDNDNDMIRNVATISANNDSFIGGIIADAYKKIGSSALLLIEDSQTPETTIGTIQGAEFQSGYLNEHFITNRDKMVSEYKDALIVVFDYEINKVVEIEKVLDGIAKKFGGIDKTPIVIFANDFGGEVASTAVKSNQTVPTKILLVKSPSAYKKEFLKDICALTGATFISDSNAGLKPQDATIDSCGRAKWIICTNALTTITGGAGENFEQHKKDIQVEIDNSKHQDFKDVYTKRLAQISGSIGIIKVGGATPVEAKERKDRIDDAVRATKCAIEEGVLVGGGKSLLLCSQVMELLIEKDLDESVGTGIEIVISALHEPLRKMCENAGLDAATIISDVKKAEKNSIGYNFKTDKMEDLLEAGVLDATKVVKAALVNAASVAGQVITAGCFIIEVPRPA